jgi:glucokinase
MTADPTTADADIAIGVDIGGTNIRTALFRGLRGAAALAAPAEPGAGDLVEAVRPVAERREPVGRERDPASVISRLAGMVGALVAEAGCSDLAVPVGIGFAGMMRGDRGFVVSSPNVGWREVPFGDLLREELGQRHRVEVENDANAIAWGEFQLGAGRGVKDVVVVYVGTGIGGGAVVNRTLVTGSGAALEIGHVKVAWDEDARRCACGLKGCIEAYAGGALLSRRARAELAGGARSAAVALAGSVEAVNPSHLDAAAANGDEYALDLWAEVGPLLGVVLANAVTLFNPQRLILGGGVLSRTPVLREHAIAALEIAVNPPAAESLVVENAVLGDDAGLVGSALLASGGATLRGDAR